MRLYELLRSVPWAMVRAARSELRSRNTVGWPEHAPHLDLEMGHGELEAALRSDHWEGCPYSLEYEGEVVNLRRPAGLAADGTPLADHVRSRDHPERDDATQLVGHREASRYEAEGAHVDETHLDWLAPADLEGVVDR